MDIITWVGIGLIAGGVASLYLNDSLRDTILDIFLGVIGAIFAGFVIGGVETINSINVFHLLIIVLGAIMLVGFRQRFRDTV